MLMSEREKREVKRMLRKDEVADVNGVTKQC